MNYVDCYVLLLLLFISLLEVLKELRNFLSFSLAHLLTDSLAHSLTISVSHSLSEVLAFMFCSMGAVQLLVF